MICFGNVPAGSVLPIFFTTYGKTNGESITMTGLAVTDIEVYKGTSVTQRSSDAGYALIDTDGIDIDGVTGLHGFSIDTGDNTDAGFYAAGSFYNVVVSAVTVDGQTVTFLAATFRIVVADNTAGTPVVDVGRISNDATAADNLEAMLDGTGGVTLTATFSGTLTTVTTLTNLPAITANWLTAAGTAADFGTEVGTAVWATATRELSGTINSFDDFVSATGGVTVEAIAANTITATSVAADAITAAKIAPDAIGASELAADAVTEIQSGLSTAAALAALALFTTRVVARCTASGVPTTTSIPTSACSPSGVAADQFKGRIIIFDNDTATTALRGQATDITASSAAATPTFTVTALTTAPASGDTFGIY